jgi:hypothetical protein
MHEPYAINPSGTCDCGAHKNKRKQFCDDCWQQIPKELCQQFKLAVHQLQLITTKCRSHLHPSPTTTANES